MLYLLVFISSQTSPGSRLKIREIRENEAIHNLPLLPLIMDDIHFPTNFSIRHLVACLVERSSLQDLGEVPYHTEPESGPQSIPINIPSPPLSLRHVLPKSRVWMSTIGDRPESRSCNPFIPQNQLHFDSGLRQPVTRLEALWTHCCNTSQARTSTPSSPIKELNFSLPTDHPGPSTRSLVAQRKQITPRLGLPRISKCDSNSNESTHCSILRFLGPSLGPGERRSE